MLLLYLPQHRVLFDEQQVPTFWLIECKPKLPDILPVLDRRLCLYLCGRVVGRCFALGFQKSESEDLSSALAESSSLSAHPLLIPTLLCELLTRSDSDEIKKQGSDLFKVEMQTTSLQIGELISIPAQGSKNSPADKLEELTR